MSEIKWLGHAGFFIKGSEISVVIDPYQVNGAFEKADYVLSTHPHFDHCSAQDIEKFVKDSTIIIGPEDSINSLKGIANEKKSLLPGEKYEDGKIVIEAVPSYNIDKSFHPKSNKWLGFIITVDGEKIYHAGDTDKISEMSNFDVDIALLPVGGTYTMTASEAAAAAAKIKAKKTIPMHYGSVAGSIKDAEEFKKLCECEVEILTKN